MSTAITRQDAHIPARNKLSLLCLLIVICLFGTANRAIGQSTPTLTATMGSPDNPAGSLEDRVELSWTRAFNQTDIITITRADMLPDGSLGTASLLDIAAPGVNVYEDYSGDPGQTYQYCIAAQSDPADQSCTFGNRIIYRPTGFDATDGLFNNRVELTWTDRSQIEDGFILYREGSTGVGFDGIDNAVDVADDPSINFEDSDFTVEFWMQKEGTALSSVLSKRESCEAGNFWSFEADESITFTISNGTQSINLISVSSIADGDWHHVAVISNTLSLQLYLDGVLEGSAFTNKIVQSNTASLRMGADVCSDAAVTQPLLGSIDEVRLWADALDQDQIRDMANDPLEGTEPNLISYWPFNEATGFSVEDQAGNNDGTILNGDDRTRVAGAPVTSLGLNLVLPANTTFYVDTTGVAGVRYTYGLAAFVDDDGDMLYGETTDFKSSLRTDVGYKEFLNPPANVIASDGQFTDRIRIAWFDQSDEEIAYLIFRKEASDPIDIEETDPIEIIEIDDGSTTGPMVFEDIRTNELFDDGPEFGVEYTYCVVTTNGGDRSENTCDNGMAGGLSAPEDVVASDETLDDRVQINWAALGATADSLQVFRVDNTLADTTLLAEFESAVVEYNDNTAWQGQLYDYCIRAFSKPDTDQPRSYSTYTCDAGTRAIVLAPENVTATDGDFEHEVSISWNNPSTTVALFKVLRDGTLIKVIPATQAVATDEEIASDTAFEYCVVASTVLTDPSSSAEVNGEISAMLTALQTEGNMAPALAMAAVSNQMQGGSQFTSKSGTGTIVDSAPLCDQGSRSILPPADLTASFDESEDHVQLGWTNNSAIQTGLVIRRENAGRIVVVDTLSASRTTFGDFSGVPGTEYTYSITAIDESGESGAVLDEGRRTLLAPTAVQASDGTSETIVQITWTDKSTAETGYHVLRRESGTEDPFVILPDTTLANANVYNDTLTISGGLLGVVYEYAVAAIDGRGSSAEISDRGNTVILPPGDVNASDAYDDKVVVTWVDESEEETGYRLTRSAGHVLDFGGNDHIALKHFNPGAQRTVCAWINTTANTESWIIGWDSNGGNSVELRVLNTGQIFYAEFDSQNFNTVTSNARVNTGSWAQVCVARDLEDSDGDGNDVQIYINGVLDKVAANISLTTNTQVLTIGARPRLNTTSKFFDGQISHVSVWNRTLTTEEINGDVKGNRLTGSEAGLVSYWPLNDGIDKTVRDLAGTNTGTLVGESEWLLLNDIPFGIAAGFSVSGKTELTDFTAAPGIVYDYCVSPIGSTGLHVNQSEPICDMGGGQSTHEV